MPHPYSLFTNSELIDQLAGITGLVWTVSLLSYVGLLFGYGNSIATTLGADPSLLLYLGGAFFVTTLWLDRLHSKLSQPTK